VIRTLGRTASAPTSPAGDLDTWTDAKDSARATKAAHASRASGRRRHVDPATCDRDCSAAEWEFLRALQEYKRTSGRMFPTWSEVLVIVQGLGYAKGGH